MSGQYPGRGFVKKRLPGLIFSAGGFHSLGQEPMARTCTGEAPCKMLCHHCFAIFSNIKLFTFKINVEFDSIAVNIFGINRNSQMRGSVL